MITWPRLLRNLLPIPFFGSVILNKLREISENLLVHDWIVTEAQSFCWEPCSNQLKLSSFLKLPWVSNFLKWACQEMTIALKFWNDLGHSSSFLENFYKKELTKLPFLGCSFQQKQKKETIYNCSVCKCLKTVLLNAVLIFIRFFPFALLKKMCFYYKLLLVLSESITLGFFFAQKVFLSSLMQYHK